MIRRVSGFDPRVTFVSLTQFWHGEEQPILIELAAVFHTDATKTVKSHINKNNILSVTTG